MSEQGEVILVIDDKVSDTSIYRSIEERNALVQQFTRLKDLIIKEHPYSNVYVDVREVINEANL